MIITLPATAHRESLATFAHSLGLTLRETPDWRKINTRRPRMVGAFRADNVRLALGTDPDHYRSYGLNGRRIDAVSWEGHRAWMHAVFTAYPDATIRTGLATYYGLADFHRKYRLTEPGVVNWRDKATRTFLRSYPASTPEWTRPAPSDAPMFQAVASGTYDAGTDALSVHPLTQDH